MVIFLTDPKAMPQQAMVTLRGMAVHRFSNVYFENKSSAKK